MKKIFILIALFVGLTYGQTVIEVNFGTLSNSVTKTMTTNIQGFTKIDSICVVAVGKGEVDVDSVDIYVGAVDKSGNTYYSSTANTFLSTLDLAAGVKGYLPLSLTGNVGLTGALVRTTNSLKIVTRGAASGNDPTDPNNFRVLLFVYGTK